MGGPSGLPVESAGTDNAMFRLGADLAVRLPRIPAAVSTVDIEQPWPPCLRPRSRWPSPPPFARGEPGAATALRRIDPAGSPPAGRGVPLADEGRVSPGRDRGAARIVDTAAWDDRHVIDEILATGR
ncbi:hypothetical protein [Actinophytocola sp.]|uniref:hypothetical protein n=1 Tax=Actinophytocola sp. TaxID=1872138 RepID=UPI002ED7A21C